MGTTTPAPPRKPPHVQIVQLATPAVRSSLVERLRKRSGPAWTLGREGPAEDDIDPFRVFLRRAWRDDPVGPPVTLSHADAEARAVAFVTANADVLGFTPADVVTFEVQTMEVPKQHAGHALGVRFMGKIPMRGYEAFESLTSTIALLVFVDVDGQIRELKNLSVIHPWLTIDTRPLLDAEDPKVLRAIVGREIYVAFEDPDRPGAPVAELRREPVGPVTAADVKQRQLVVFVSNGPEGAYVAYHLAYAVVVMRRGQQFRFVVSADTGELLEDAAVAVVKPNLGGML